MWVERMILTTNGNVKIVMKNSTMCDYNGMGIRMILRAVFLSFLLGDFDSATMNEWMKQMNDLQSM